MFKLPAENYNNTLSKITMAVIRGVRPNVISFYEDFEKINIRFVAGSFKPFHYENTKKNFEFVNLPYYNFLKIDPAQVLRQFGNLSWIYIKDLDEKLKGSDIVNISDTYYFPNYQAVKWAKKNSVPIVCVIWTTIPKHITSWFPPYSYITKKVVEATDLFILRSKTTLAFTDSLGIPRTKVKVIYKGIDLNKFKPSSISHKSSVINILFTGNLSRAKGLDDLITCYLSLVTRYPKLKLVIAGDGEMREEVEGLERRQLVDFRGFVDYEKLPKLYQDADIFCAPSKFQKFLGLKVWEEYFSYALMEALASGLPIVATKSGGVPEEVGKDNVLVEHGNREELKGALVKLIEDESLRKSIGLRNRRRAETLFDAKKQARKTEEEILKLL